MRKLTVEVYLPAAQRAFDVRIPADMTMAQASELVASALRLESEGVYLSGDAPLLCDRESGDIFNINMTVWDLGIRNGSALMMI